MAILGNNSGVGAGAFAEGFRQMYFPMKQQQTQEKWRQAEADRLREATAMQQAQMANQEKARQANLAIARNPQLATMPQSAYQDNWTRGVGGGADLSYASPDMIMQARKSMLPKEQGVKVIEMDGPSGYGKYAVNPQTGASRFLGGARTQTGQVNITIPKGYAPEYGDTGQIVGLTPIPGSPAAIEAAEVTKKGQMKKAQSDIKKGIVVEDIDRIFNIMDESKIPSVGLGSVFSFIPQTGAADIERTLNSIRASVGFDTLQQMRDASPTGGALGQVSERENALLQSALGSLDPSLSPEMFRYNLDRVKSLYLDIIHGPGNWDADTGKTNADMELTADIASQFLQETGGDKEKARQLARDRGYKF